MISHRNNIQRSYFMLQAYAAAVPGINANLQQSAPQIPLVSRIGSATLHVSDGMVLVVANEVASSTEWIPLTSAVAKGCTRAAVPSTTLPCPDLSITGAHQDDCST